MRNSARVNILSFLINHTVNNIIYKNKKQQINNLGICKNDLLNDIIGFWSKT